MKQFILYLKISIFFLIEKIEIFFQHWQYFFHKKSFSIFRAMRLYLKGQYAQGFTKAYTYDFTNKVNGESNSFTGFSRGSYIALRTGVKFNFGYLRS